MLKDSLRAFIGRVALRMVEIEKKGQLLKGANVYELLEVVKRGAQIAEGYCGLHSPEAVSWLLQLGDWYREAGDPEAEQILRRAESAARAVYGSLDPHVAIALSNRGGVCSLLGRLEEAESCYEEALAIDTMHYGLQHPETLTDMNNLAILRLERNDANRGDVTTARLHLEHVRKIDAAILDPFDRVIAQDHQNWAGLLLAEGDWAGAEREVRQSLAILERAWPHLTVEIAGALGTLAKIVSDQGPHRQAEALHLAERTLAIDEEYSGVIHPSIVGGLCNLATIHVRQGKLREAVRDLDRACRVDDMLLKRVLAISSERQRLIYLERQRRLHDAFITLVSQHCPDVPEAICSALDLVLRHKGITTELLAIQRDVVIEARYPAAQSLFAELNALRSRIARQTLAGPGSTGRERHEQQLSEWSTRQEHLEVELARLIPEMNLEQRLSDAGRKDVAQALPAGSVLVEFVRFNVFAFNAIPARRESEWQPPRYLAFTLPAGDPDNVRMIDLGEAEPIEQMLERLGDSIAGDASRSARGLGLLPAVTALHADSCALRLALFDPIVPALENHRRLLISADGELTRLPFEVLPTCEGRYLLDEYTLSYVSAGRDTLRFDAIRSGHSAPPFIVADPDFDLEEAGPATPAPTNHATDSLRSSLRDQIMQFPRLPWTAREGEQIADILDVKPCMGRGALEACVKAVRSPNVLHLATHGFFLRTNGANSGSGHPTPPGALAPSLKKLSQANLTNPLLRSGLVLAGVNTWLMEGPLPPEAEDGILTAEDVLGLDLLTTDLVVLSACETARGKVYVGEGVFGLQRAFVVAGARTLVMSLWKVPDKPTQELMVDFYRRLHNGQPRAVALREAQLALRVRCPDPADWGAFICQGDPGPLPTS